jgi:hypothetical protein
MGLDQMNLNSRFGIFQCRISKFDSKTCTKDYENLTKRIQIPTRDLDLKEKNFDIHLDIGVGLGSEMKFKSRDLDFNEFPISERFRPFLNRKFGI